MDTREYFLQFDDGVHLVYSANLIAKNMYSSQVDSRGRQYMLVMSVIVDHSSEGRAVRAADGFYVDKHGQNGSE